MTAKNEENKENIEKSMIGCPCNDGCGQYRNYLNGNNPDDECEGFDYSCIEFDQWAKKKGIYPHNSN